MLAQCVGVGVSCTVRVRERLSFIFEGLHWEERAAIRNTANA